MILRPTCVIMPAAITGRDSTARYIVMNGPTAACAGHQLWQSLPSAKPGATPRYALTL